uniref:Uncharacterized protein n=1 Tax=Anguilla anguilla TaxID=7936 RepID=A0A0E9WLW1_ANGAN
MSSTGDRHICQVLGEYRGFLALWVCLSCSLLTCYQL